MTDTQKSQMECLKELVLKLHRAANEVDTFVQKIEFLDDEDESQEYIDECIKVSARYAKDVMTAKGYYKLCSEVDAKLVELMCRWP